MIALKTLVDESNGQLLTIEISLFFIFLIFFIGRWLYNRKRFNELAHQIPAGVVKNYLDSIIQNSSALKSSLFRGGGLDIGEGVPSVLPVTNLTGGEHVSADPELLSQKNAEIASLQAKLSEKNKQVKELEDRINELESSSGGGGSDEEAQKLKGQVKDLEAKLKATQADLEKAKASAGSGGGGGAEVAGLKKELDAVTKERNELKERLQEYEIIEDDLANLKKLQQENEQLKKALSAAGLPVPESTEAPPTAKAAPAAEAEAESEAEPVAAASAPEEDSAPAQEEDTPAAAAPEEDTPVAEASTQGPAEAEPEAAAPAEEKKEEASGEAPAVEGQGKSAEDLLSEFEKMLG